MRPATFARYALALAFVFTGFGWWATAQAQDTARRADATLSPSPQTDFSLPRGGDIVQDGSFETGSPNDFWDEFESTFGSPLCNLGCGTGAGTGPFDGNWWVWFGGISSATSGHVEQELTIPSSGSATLSFYLEIPAAGQAGSMTVRMDGDELFSVTEADATTYATYQEVTVDVSAYADGGTHTLRIESETQTGAAVTNFFVDLVSITTGGGGDTPIASFTPPLAEGLAVTLAPDQTADGTITITNTGGADLTFTFTDFAGAARGGDVFLSEDFEGAFPPAGWTTEDATGQCPWLTSDDYEMTGWAGGARGAAIDADDCGTTGIVVDASLITPALDLSTSTGTHLEFDLAFRYYIFGEDETLTLDVSSDGGSTWTTLQTWEENYAYPGAPWLPVDIDLSAYDGESSVMLRWRYQAGWDWWVFVDNVVVSSGGGGGPSGEFVTAVSPAMGTIAPGASADVTVTFDASGFAEGTHDASLAIETNEPASYDYPVSMTVQTGGGGEGDLVFDPAIETGLEATAEAGATTTGTVTLTNPTDTPIAFDFSQYSGGPERPMAPAYGPQTASAPLAKGAERPTRGAAQAFRAGGPDAFGYEWIDSNEDGGPVFTFEDISGIGTALAFTPTDGNTSWPAEDEGYADIDLPFAFPFYGETYGQARVISNGLITFDMTYTDPGFNSFSNGPLPSAATPNLALYPFWDDLTIEGGNVYFHADASRAIIQYEAGRFGSSGIVYTFQVVLYPGGAIEYRYESMTGTLNSATIGIENADGTDGLQIARDQAYVEDGLAIRISAAPAFVTGVSPATGVIPAGGSVDVEVAFDATSLIGGTYTGNLVIETDEPATYDYPVTLVVTGEGVLTASPDPLAFGEVIIGVSETQTLTITNEGTDVSSITAVSASNAAYTTDFSGPVELAPGASTTVAVTFAPSAEGAANATLTVAASSGDITVGLTGSGLRPPEAELSVEDLALEIQVGTTSTASITLSNEAAAGAADLTFEAAVVAARPGQARLAEPAQSRRALGANAGTPVVLRGTDAVVVRADGSTTAAPYVEYTGGPRTHLRGGETMITHSLSQDIWELTGVACGNAFGGYTTENSFWRVFDLAQFEAISGSFAVTAVEVGVETASGPTLGTTVRLYTLDGAFVTSNLTLVGEASSTVPSGTTLQTITVPVTGEFAADDVLVVEWFVEHGEATGSAVYPGANSAGETAPSYISSASCGINEPVTYASIEFPEVHLVMNVYGQAGPALLAVSPESGSVAPGASQELTLTVDASEAEVGEYAFEVVLATNDPARPTVTIPVTIAVLPEVATEDGALPSAFALSQNYPNPFASRTVIEYALPEAGPVKLAVYDAVGRLVATLVEGERPAGYHEVVWEAGDLASGVYFYRLEAGAYQRTHKLVVVK